MDGLGLGLSRGFRLSTMASYAMVTNRYGVWGRTVAAMIMLVAAGLFASPTWRAVQLLPLLAGVAFAWLGAHPTSAETETGSGIARRWLTAHPALDTAGANLAGLLEAFGAVAAALLFAGPLPVSMSPGPRVVALAALTAFTWNAFSQVAAAPGYYNMSQAPAPWVVAVRWLLPAVAAVVAFVTFRGFGAAATIAPVPLWLAAPLAGSFLLIWPYVGTLNLLLRCAAACANDEVVNNLGVQERIHYEYVHRAKNELSPDFREVAPGSAEYLAYSTAVVIVDNVIRDIEASDSDNRDDAHSVEELWRRYRRTVSGVAARERLRLVDLTSSRMLSHMEGLILQSIFVGLVSNALRASPDGPIVVTVSDEMDDMDAPTVRVVVEDEGVGGAPSTFEEGSGLAHLHDLCSRYKGGVRAVERDGGGTRVIAAFSYPAPISTVGDFNNSSRKGTSDGPLPGLGSRRRSSVHIGRGRLAPPGS